MKKINSLYDIQEEYEMLLSINPYKNAGGGTLKNGLISVWEFNETSGTDAFDAHGSNDGTIVGATVNQTSVTNLDKCYSFNSSDRVTMPTFNFLSGDFSVSFWIDANSKASNYTIFNKRLNSGTFPGLNIWWQLTTGFIVASIDLDASTVSAVSTTVVTGAWHHIAVVRNGDDLFIYIDGVEEHSVSGATGDVDNSNDLRIGANRKNQANTDGEIDQPAIWNRVLSQPEITALYDSGNGLAYVNW